MTMLRYRNLRTLAAASAKAENAENALKPRRLGYNAAGLFALAFVGVTSTAASAGEYCRRDINEYGALSCGFETMAQCKAMSSGRGGDCLRDPFLASPSSAYDYQPKHSHSKTRKPREN